MKGVKMDKKEIREGAPFAVLSYILFFWIFTYIYKKDNRFAVFHARQGLIIFIGNIICYFLGFIPILGVIFILGQIALVFASFYGIYSALVGKMNPIGVINQIVDRLVI